MANPPPPPPAAPVLRRPADLLETRRGLACLVGGPAASEAPPSSVAAGIEHFMAYASSAGIDPSRQVQGLDAAGAVAGMCLWVPSPGRTAMLFAPNLREHPAAAGVTAACIGAALADAAAAGIILVQAMLETDDRTGQETFAAAGLTPLATLTYMERRPPMLVPSVTLPAGVRLEAYSAATHELFKKTIQRTYEETLDCPALSGLRDMEDVIAGHKAVGPFDPHLWTLVMEHNLPLGVLLMSEIPARKALELVYLGLTPEARGRGLGRSLMNRVLGIASRRAYAITTLAVDASNTPAVRLYRRCGYTRTGERVAMIRKL